MNLTIIIGAFCAFSFGIWFARKLLPSDKWDAYRVVDGETDAERDFPEL